jgi:hypothetical protein
MNSNLRRSSVAAGCCVLACGLMWACGDPTPPDLVGASGTGGSGLTGQQGTLGGMCRANATCDANLACLAGYCLPTTTGTGGTSGGKQGSIGAACYANNTCDANLSCLVGYCVPSSGTGGVSAGGATGQGGTFAQGGTPQGGAAQGGAAHGGSPQGGAPQGGAPQGGAAQGGAGGTPTTAIVAVDGWIAAGSNTVGVVGPWFVYSDVNSTINVSPAGGTDFTGAGSQICVSGTVSQLDTYGPTIGFNFNEPDTVVGAYVPSAHGVTGFSFGISGTVPSALQVGYHTVGDTAEYCSTILTPSALSNTVSLAGTRLDCWMTGGAAGSAAGSYQSLQFQLPVNYFSNGQAFNFCITNLKATTG